MSKKCHITRLAAITCLSFLLCSAGGTLVIHAGIAAAPPAAQQDDAVTAVKAAVKPEIDGVLDEETWQTQPIKKNFITYDPLYGDKLPQETTVWVAYDNDNLYFAFLCHDTEPGKIQTSITKRDNVFNDDWVSVSIDAAGTGQTAYVLYVNPNGIQGDGLISAAASEEDISPDFVWQSAARITPAGYQVEIALPLKSISFKSGKDVKIGILFRRKITRLGYSAAWPDIPPGHSILNRQTGVIFKNLKKQLKLEVLPCLTHSNDRVRIDPNTWSESDAATEFGIGFKYGITSSITADITINPDFSQVESDAFQVEVNQRYPLFYIDKRPFFMAGADMFKFYTITEGFCPEPVHTRQIVAPAWGTKITGSWGKISFGLLSAGDEWPGQPWLGSQNPDEGENAFFGIVRGKYSLGKDNYFGLLYSGREFAGQYNRVIGADFGHRIGKNQRLNTSFLHSFSQDEGDSMSRSSTGTLFDFEYIYNSKPLGFKTAFEHIGDDFRMDSSFLMRRGVNNAFLWLGIGLYPESKKIPWLKMISPDFRLTYTHDLLTKMEDIQFDAALYFLTVKEGMLVLDYTAIKECWQGFEFDLDQVNVVFRLRFNKWLKIQGLYTYGDRIYYAAEPAFKGKGHYFKCAVILQPGRKINQHFSYIYSDLYKDNEKIYTVNIPYSRTTYQFNKYFFLRAVVQYDSYRKRLLTDFLASFTLIPGTVLHLGYGGLFENWQWQDNQWLYRQGEMINTRRSIFAKVSYLLRF